MRRGYTLIEVVVVLLVLGLAAAVAVPAIGRGADTIRVRAEVAGFASFLRAAREQAVTRSQPHQVSVDPEARRLELRVLGREGGERPAVAAVRQLSGTLQIEPDPPAARTVTFLPRGLSSGGRFRLAAPGSRVWVVTVDPLTGRVVTRQAES